MILYAPNNIHVIHIVIEEKKSNQFQMFILCAQKTPTLPTNNVQKHN